MGSPSVKLGTVRGKVSFQTPANPVPSQTQLPDLGDTRRPQGKPLNVGVPRTKGTIYTGSRVCVHMCVVLGAGLHAQGRSRGSNDPRALCWTKCTCVRPSGFQGSERQRTGWSLIAFKSLHLSHMTASVLRRSPRSCFVGFQLPHRQQMAGLWMKTASRTPMVTELFAKNQLAHTKAVSDTKKKGLGLAPGLTTASWGLRRQWELSAFTVKSWVDPG